MPRESMVTRKGFFQTLSGLFKPDAQKQDPEVEAAVKALWEESGSNIRSLEGTLNQSGSKGRKELQDKIKAKDIKDLGSTSNNSNRKNHEKENEDRTK